MASENESEKKVYIEIVKQLRNMIEKDGLKVGDKIPSERELAERLNAGRSSVREALRALELLGLIETRRGEGTFIRDFRGNQLVQLLSTFILQDKKVINDVFETKTLIEINCLQLAFFKMADADFIRLKTWVNEHNFDDVHFFSEISVYAENHLLTRMWKILVDYYRSLDTREAPTTKEQYIELTSALQSRNWERVLEAYRRLRNLSVD
ncbi:GntR family transcriptional regulator [Bacillus sp. B15-48]|uniref:FadR/GntR family transcriptional regulator n=1 Tax=Bacillus sp. B15-48 TaxID=1548601 RepID=UPI0019400140|nr:GntR family transcriptional regulator [Bacillus sp. B15-48]MBM4762540.1 GntR family transcriptional regulator [Bacillus sp. B15-48]